MPNRTPEQQHWREDNCIPPKTVADCYKLDKRYTFVVDELKAGRYRENAIYAHAKGN